MVQRISLGLDCPKFFIKSFCDQVYAFIPPPTPRPIVPQPDTFDYALIFGIVLQKPFADALKLPPTPMFIRTELAKEIKNGSHKSGEKLLVPAG